MTTSESVSYWQQAAQEAQDAGLMNAAAMYRQTARSLEKQQETGVAVCVCCLKPFGRGPLHR